MKVFISWSGARSQKVVFALREWIPSVVNDVDAWVSEEDIAKGAHWPTHLGRELQEAQFGIICLTPENLNEPWLLFEAGALSKVIDQARVSPYLFDLEKAQVKPPLGHFQATKAEKGGTKKLLHSINGTIEESKGRFLPQQRLDAAFEKWWPDLESQLAAVPKNVEPKPNQRPTEEVIGEILEAVRGLSRDVPAAIRELQSLMPVGAGMTDSTVRNILYRPMNDEVWANWIAEKFRNDELKHWDTEAKRALLRLIKAYSKTTAGIERDEKGTKSKK